MKKIAWKFMVPIKSYMHFTEHALWVCVLGLWDKSLEFHLDFSVSISTKISSFSKRFFLIDRLRHGKHFSRKNFSQRCLIFFCEHQYYKRLGFLGVTYLGDISSSRKYIEAECFHRIICSYICSF